MCVSEREWPAARLIHLSGGCRAINNPGPTVDLHPAALNGKNARIDLKEYGAIYADLESLGLPIVGVDFYSHVMEVEGRVPPNWRPYHKSPISVWSCQETGQKWRRISLGAHQRKNGRLWDLASRISHQSRVCGWRLRQISDAYHEQLVAHLQDGEFLEGQCFEDEFTWLAYLSIQSFLVDACVLRDYLAEFAAHFVYGPQAGIGKVNVTSMSGLKTKFLDKSAQSDSLSVVLKEATGDGGWIKELGSYRNLVVHSAPLAKAQKKLLAVSAVLKIGDSSALPSIRCPIPQNPQGISAARACGEHFEDFTAQFDAFVSAAVGESPSADGLAYSHGVLGRLGDLSSMLSDRSPVPPEKIVINKADLLEPIQIRSA